MPTHHAPPTPRLASLTRAVEALAAGQMIIVVDDADRENEGDLVMAAQHVTAEQMAFIVRHGTGIVCTPMGAERLEELSLPQMVPSNNEIHHTAFTVSVDHTSTGTGVSAADRAATARALADPQARAADFRRPGHIFPLQYREGGVVRRGGHTEASLDLLGMAGCVPVAVICEIVEDDGTMARPGSLRDFATTHDLPIVTVADIVRHRRATEELVEATGSATLPTEFGEFRAIAYRSLVDGQEHLALVMGDVGVNTTDDDGVLVRVHSECLTGDIVGSLKCDCGTQLRHSMERIAKEGRGVVVYLRGQEGRGIGLGHKLRAYALQEQGRDTVDANTDLGLPVDSREYGVGAGILAHLGVRRIRLITNNPDKYGGLAGFDLDLVGRVALPPSVTRENVAYLETKRRRMGHWIDLDGVAHRSFDTDQVRADERELS